MNALYLLLVGLGALAVGSLLGYAVRQTIAKRRAGTIEQKLKKRVTEAEEESKRIREQARTEANQILERAQKEEDSRREELRKTEQLLHAREQTLEKKALDFEKKEQDLSNREEGVKQTESEIQEKRNQAVQALEQAASLSEEEAKQQLFSQLEQQYEKDILGRIKQLETEGQERFEARARDIVAYAIQKTAVSQTQEITTTAVTLPSEEVKGKIIGKEGRNIRALERAAGVEVVVDEAPETVVISGFDAVRRHIAKTALERLIQDGRIHPARVEEEVAKVKEEVDKQIKEAGETALYDVGIVGIDPKLVSFLGRLKFRTSYGQNVLLHSIEVAHLAAALAAEIGADPEVAKKAGLFHDIGKALDHQIEGSHVEIGIRVLEKFGVEKAVVTAMKSHHEEYPYETIEAVLVQAADAISASRPGARKDTLENYLKRIGDLERLASSFEGIDKAYAIQAGREIRVFVQPNDITDVQSHQLARDIASRIQEELRYPGEIKVTLIREQRFVEYAR